MNILIICNPNSGRGNSFSFAKKLKKRIEKVSSSSAEIYLSESVEKMREFFAEIKKERPNFYNSILILGGDGTFSLAVDALLKIGLNVPVAIFPLGTVNDFAKQTHMAKSVKKCVSTILAQKTKKCDVAFVNGDYVVSDSRRNTNFTTSKNNTTLVLVLVTTFSVTSLLTCILIKRKRQVK